MQENKSMGYARVSSTGQNLDRQLVELKKFVPEQNIVIDKMKSELIWFRKNGIILRGEAI